MAEGHQEADRPLAATLEINHAQTQVPIEASKSPKTKSYHHLLAGGLAGLISAISLQPFDLLKTRLQQQQKGQNEKLTLSQELKKFSNVKELWRGAIPSALRTSVGAGLYFTSLSISRDYLAGLKKNQDLTKSSTSVLPKLSAYENLIVGSLMRALVGLATMPITVVKTRFESNEYNYKTIYEAVKGIYEDGGSRGSLTNFFRGSIATLARDCPYAGLYVLFYELLKNDFIPKVPILRVSENELNTENERLLSLSAIINSTSAILAASLATTITAPFDAIKTRLQLSDKRMSFSEATLGIIQEKGGSMNLLRGLSLRLGRKAVSSGISWCIYEELIKMSVTSSSSKLK